MKRVNNLYEKLISDANLTEAITTVVSTHRWKHYPTRPNKTSLWMATTIDERVIELRSIIEKGFKQGPTKLKRRYDRAAKKWRDISEPLLWPDQCVHHALIQVLQPVMMRGMDVHCCGSIKGRGAHYGIRYIKKWMKRGGSDVNYCLELDIKQFYNSLKPEVVLDRMRELIKDYRVMSLIEAVIENGVLIGTYCSQWFANTVLQPLDAIIRKAGASHYIRYMDNFTIFSNRKKTLRKILKVCKKWLGEHGLDIKGNWQIFSTKDRLPNALGYRFGRGYTLLRKHALLSFKRQLKKYYKMRLEHKEPSLHFTQGLLSRFGMLKHCNSYKFYKIYVQDKTQKHLKDVVRKYQREVNVTWDMYLEQYVAMAI